MKRVFLSIFVFSILIITGPFPLYSDEKVTVAVLDLAPKGVPSILAKAVSDIIRSEFVNIANFTVVERSQMKAILDEQSLQMTGCTDSSCAVQFGKILSARRIVVGEITKMGKGAIITIRYIDVQKGSAMFSSKSKAKTLDDIDTAAEKAAKKLAQRIITEDKEVLSAKTMQEYYIRSIVPGLGQFYAENTIHGSISAGLFILSCGASYYAYSDFKKKDDDYHALNRGNINFDSKFDEYDKAGKIFDYSLYLIGLMYALNWVDVLFLVNTDFAAGAGADQAALDKTFFDFNTYGTGPFAFSHVPEMRFGLRFGMRF